MCCATTDVDHEYHPGDTVVLHWSAIAAPAPAHDRLVTLSAGLLGPFDDIDTLRSLAPLHDGHIKVKVAGGHVDATLAARGSQVTRITIPTGTPPGYYALETSAGPAVGDPCWAQQTCEEGHQNAPMVVRVSS
jgi:hypothetical protein